MEELERAELVLHACGLRFDGYGYADAMRARDVDTFAWLNALSDTFCRTLAVPRVMEEAFALMFCFQRGAKDYGWFLSRSAESVAGPVLFLHLYSLPTPQRWRFQDFADLWDRISSEDKEDAAAIVRRWLTWGTGTAKIIFKAP